MNNKRLMITFFSLIFITAQIMAYELQGVITDEEGKPVHGASVRLYDSRRNELGSDNTDNHGEYRIRGLPGGTFTLQINRSGFSSYSTQVSIGGPNPTSTVYYDVRFSEINLHQGVGKADTSAYYMPVDYPVSRRLLALIKKGEKQLAKENPSKAISIFQKALSLDPDFPRTHTYLGVAYLQKKQPDQAIPHLDTAIQKNPKDPLPFTHLGKYYYVKNEFERAATNFQKAVDLESGLAENHIWLGKTFYQMKKWTECESAMTQSLLIDPRKLGEDRLLLADAYIKLDRPAEARAQYSAFLRDNPYSPQKQDVLKKIREIDSGKK